MKFGYLFELKNAFEESKFNNLKGERFTYALTKNEDKINTYVRQSMRDISEKNKEAIQKYQEYSKKVDEIEKKFKNKENDKLIEDLVKKLENKDITEEEKKEIEKQLEVPKEIQKQNYDEIEKHLVELNKENQETIKNYREINNQFKKMMDEEIEFEYYKIKRSIIPDDISYEQRKLLNNLIYNDIPEEEIK
jgi:uncharacterized protein (DUF885 family)